jgi:hypothetical protein
MKHYKNRECTRKLNNDNNQTSPSNTGRNTLTMNGQCAHARGKTMFPRVSFIIMTNCLKQRHT